MFRGHPPSLERAAQIAAALGLELYIGPPRGVSGASKAPSEFVSRAPGDKFAAPGAPPGGASGVALERVADLAIAELLAALADEYEALNARGRESLLARFWGLHPDLRERERRRVRVVAWLGWRVVEGRRERPAAASKQRE